MHWIGWVIALLLAAILIQIIYYQNRRDYRIICDYLNSIDKKIETLIIKIESGNKIMWNGLDKISSSVDTVENQNDMTTSFIGEHIETISKKIDYYFEKQEAILESDKSSIPEDSDLMDQHDMLDDEENTDKLW